MSLRTVCHVPEALASFLPPTTLARLAGTAKGIVPTHVTWEAFQKQSDAFAWAMLLADSGAELTYIVHEIKKDWSGLNVLAHVTRRAICLRVYHRDTWEETELGDAFLASFIERQPFEQVPGIFRLDDYHFDRLLTVTLSDIRNKIDWIIRKLEDLHGWFLSRSENPFARK